MATRATANARAAAARVKKASKVVGAGEAARLVDERRVQNHRDQVLKAGTIHEKQRLLAEIGFYPAHSARKETTDYKKVHHKLVVEQDLPCLVCGVKNSTLKSPAQNRYGARALETHHHVIEWAMANAIDVNKFNRILRPSLARRHPGNALYKKPMSEADVLAWVDHSEDNLWVLCDVHHRAKYFGIHEISYPIWCPMDLFQPQFESYVQKQLKNMSTAEKPGTTTADARKAKARKKR
ncbi:MAG TPA: hypothetical protein VMU08_17290 [Rhizomicrobium sp.]|nr:hypothetical protein [Rhizomicrobium sp.]